MSCSSWTAWITDPEPRKSRPLKKPCVIRWKIAAVNAPTPSDANMYPSWLSVEYASTRLMSVWVIAIDAARIAVKMPIDATTTIVDGADANSRLARATRYTPALTIVAAWISADTGVGPSMASGSQTWRGNWALLPIAPANTSRATIGTGIGNATSVGESSVSRDWRISSVPVFRKMAMMPSANPTSP